MNYFILSDGSLLNLSLIQRITKSTNNSEYLYEVEFNRLYCYISETDYNNLLASLKYRNLVVNE
jgi:hypothetical protein